MHLTSGAVQRRTCECLYKSGAQKWRWRTQAMLMRREFVNTLMSWAEGDTEGKIFIKDVNVGREKTLSHISVLHAIFSKLNLDLTEGDTGHLVATIFEEG